MLVVIDDTLLTFVYFYHNGIPHLKYLIFFIIFNRECIHF
jgi:hypothetical protein